MGQQTNDSDSKNFITALQIIIGIVLIGFFAFLGAWFALADRAVFIAPIFYYFITGFIAGCFIKKWWAPTIIAFPNMVFSLISRSRSSTANCVR